MKTLFLFTLAAIFFIYGHSQTIPTKNDLVNHYGITEHLTQDGVMYYSYLRGVVKKTKLIVYLQGSDPSPQFSYTIKDSSTVSFNCFFNKEFKSLSKEYVYVVVEKTGFEGLFDEANIEIPKTYISMNSLDNRVSRVNSVINELNSQYDFEKIIVYGHSEGAPVAAKLATVNNHITHLGFWAGNALPDFYDFILEDRIRFYQGKVSDKEAQQSINETINGFSNHIAKDTSNIEASHYTNKRWWSYAEPPINHLLKLDIPIYVQVASLDKSAPIESTYLIPLEFARLKKNNLTYKVCVGCDHSFSVSQDDGTIKDQWNNIFVKFLKWTEDIHNKP